MSFGGPGVGSCVYNIYVRLFVCLAVDNVKTYTHGRSPVHRAHHKFHLIAEQCRESQVEMYAASGLAAGGVRAVRIVLLEAINSHGLGSVNEACE